MAIGLYESPKPRELYTKLFTISRTDTTSNIKAYLPKDAVIVNVFISATADSNAATTASISLGSTSGGTDILSSYNVKTGSTGFRISASSTGTLAATKLTANIPVWATYAETGTASSTGGPWLVQIQYIYTGPGEGITD